MSTALTVYEARSAAKIARIKAQQERERMWLEGILKVVDNPAVELIGGTAIIESLFNAGIFGNPSETSTQNKTSISLFPPGFTVSQLSFSEAKNKKNQVEMALYIILVAKALGPTGLSTLAGLGESALQGIFGTAKAIIPAASTAMLAGM